MKVLILGGTDMARALASRLAERGVRVETSLAGRTATPLLPEGGVRIGGFGGAAGLEAYLRAHGFDSAVDATHPYAARISANAVLAAAAAGLPLLRLVRPQWPDPGDWLHATDIVAAAALLPERARVFLTIGRQEVAPFLARAGCTFLLRAIEAPAEALPANVTLVLARPPFALADEIALMRAHEVTHLVSKNSGGAQTRAKLDAARTLGVRVVMVARPVLLEAETVDTIDAAVQRLLPAS